MVAEVRCGDEDAPTVAGKCQFFRYRQRVLWVGGAIMPP
jgi:hypothetical protein